MRRLLRRIIIWALNAEEYKHDPADLDREAANNS